MESTFEGTLLAATIVTKNRNESLRFYQDTLGYNIIEEGTLSELQKSTFGKHLINYTLLGHDRASLIRLLETSNHDAHIHRLNAQPWDTGLCVIEAGTPDIERVYVQLLRNRYGVIAPPEEFTVQGPEPLGLIVMKALGIYGPSGEQIFITEIKERHGGTPLWELRNDLIVYPPGNVVISLKNRIAQEFYEKSFALEPVIDLLLNQSEAAKIMAGPADMSFRMCLMGNDQYKSGMEQHVYEECNPEYNFKSFPSDFSKVGLASVCWKGKNLKQAANLISLEGGTLMGTTLLPLRNNPTPKGIVFRGLVGEIIELSE